MPKEKVAIVTGAASGIGLAIATSFAADGAHVMFADINEAELVKRAGAAGQPWSVVNLSRRDDCKRLVDETLAAYGRVDILVNVAGVQTVAPIDEFPEDRWDFIMALMLSAPFYLTRYVWPSMKANGWGRVININSIHGLVASEFKAAYVSAKHGLMGLTKTAGLEGGPLGITVNSICPSYVRTPLVDHQIAEQARSHGISESQVISDIMLAKSSIKHLLEPETIADIAMFLCTPAADYITGAAIPVDGGWTAA